MMHNHASILFLLIDNSSETEYSFKRPIRASYDFNSICHDMLDRVMNSEYSYDGLFSMLFGTKKSNYTFNNEYNIRINNGRVAIVQTNERPQSAFRDPMDNINAFTYDLSKTYDMKTITFEPSDPFYCTNRNPDDHPNPFGFTKGSLELCQNFNANEKVSCSCYRELRNHVLCAYKDKDNFHFEDWMSNQGLKKCSISYHEQNCHICSMNVPIWKLSDEIKEMLRCQDKHDFTHCRLCDSMFIPDLSRFDTIFL